MKKTALISFLFGALGLVTVYAGWHLWQDHHNLHALVAVEVQREIARQQQQAGQAQQPQVGPQK
jgi:hypothetical protein